MKLEFRVPGEENKVLGAGGYWIDNDEVPSLSYTGLWDGDEVIAIVLMPQEDYTSTTKDSINKLNENCETITSRVNAHDELVAALKLAQEALKHSVPQMAHYPEPVARHEDALAAVEQALRYT